MPKKSADPLLIETATTLRNMNERLFGGPGQPDGGALHFIMGQHKELAQRIEDNKKELTDKLDNNKKELLDKIDEKKKETDADIKEVRDNFTGLDRKVNRWSGAIAAAEFALTTGLVWMGVHYHGRG